ncbi:MAG TPA: DUF2127 domain-containing protein [Verrucomicrobiae bacterium]|nr:DUF2127 domain-containing protein [Verrucomicrobiae bacterium]
MAETKDIPIKKRAPTLYFIIAVKLIKGVALLLLALGVFTLANKDLPDLFNQFLRWVHLDPENRFFTGIGDWLETITPTNVRVVASGTFLCGLFLLAEGFGLAFRAKWAIWLTIGESVFFIPVEIFELIRPHAQRADESSRFPYPKLGILLVLALNILIVSYLFKNRNRLFRHHETGTEK